MFSPHGYVKIRVGKAHPLADPNGYCYEHRLVIAAAYGIDAIRGNIVHHKNDNKTDNRIENLEIIKREKHNSIHNLRRGRDGNGRFLPACHLLDGKEHMELPE